ncbi:MAG: hypothetical protein AB1437_09365 [Pseudomonadota bacterium]
MIEPWAKRAFAWGAFAALAHSAAWAGYVYHLQRASYDALEQRRGVIEAIRYNQVGVGGVRMRMATMVLTVRPLDRPGAQPQEFNSDAPFELASPYFERHRAGDIVTTWVHRRSGRIVDVLPPDRPDFARYLAILLPTLGLFTFFIIVGIVGHVAHRHGRT